MCMSLDKLECYYSSRVIENTVANHIREFSNFKVVYTNCQYRLQSFSITPSTIMLLNGFMKWPYSSALNRS